jgi:uncharacterized protein involved in exopolysaccharide biosynthesis
MFKRYGWMLLVMAPVGMMAGLMLAAAVTYVMPKKYESFATIEIKNRTMVQAGNGESMHLQIQTTDFEKIKSRNSLSKVIDSLDLMNRWGLDRESALRILKGIVQTENIRGTDLIQIRIRHTNKEDARDIAAEVARAYKDYRDEVYSEPMEKDINAFRKAVREQEDKVEELRKKLTEISRSSSNTYGGTNPADMQDYVAAKRDFETGLALLEAMKEKLITEDISQDISFASVVVHDDPVIADTPISPSVALNLIAGAGGGILLSPFLALPLMWWMNRRSSRAVQAAVGF